MKQPLRRVHLLIEGRVQGVGFRWWFESRARDLGLAGWVRNRPDGNVEAVFSGPPDTIETMLTDCRDGPPLARVTGLQVTDCDPPGTKGFQIRPDG